MEKFKNEYVSELLHVGLTPEQAAKAIQALSVVLQGYNLTPKDANLTVYNEATATLRLIKLYIDCKLVENCSPAYCKNLSIFLPKLFEYTNKEPKEVTAFDVRAFMATWQRDRNVSGRTMDKYRQMIHNFFAWLVTEGYMDRNPCSAIKRVKQETKERESLSQMELEIIRSSLINDREKMLIELLFSSGCRASEVCHLKLNDINLETGKVLLYGKGRKEREGLLSPKARLAIKTYLKSRGFESDYLFCNTKYPHGEVGYRSVENLVRKIEERVRKDIQHHLHPHLFRHTTATVAINNGMPVQDVQMLLGHKSIDTTMIYAKADKSQLQIYHAKCIS